MTHHLLIQVALRSMMEKTAKKLHVVEDPGDMVRYAKPGDIIVTSATKNEAPTLLGRAAKKVYWAGARLRLGDRTHVAMVTRPGKAVNVLFGEKATEVPIQDLVSNLDAHIVRPTAKARERKAAVSVVRDVVKQQLPYGGTTKQFMKLWLTPNAQMDRPNNIKENLICSNLITRAYSNVKFHPEKMPEMVNPADFVNSPATKPVALLKNKFRHDPENRTLFPEKEIFP
jgi:hypothetical protein